MVKQLVQCTALEGAYFNIRVNAVASGVVNSKARMKSDLDARKVSTEKQNTEVVNKLGLDVPLGGRPIEPSEVAYSLLFLGSDDCQMVNGEVTVVDGGLSLTTDRYDDFAKSLALGSPLNMAR
jgi:NAD(P)-dependent dehydrogenase (short-subunit alcohol dehydrogenase family)